MALDSIASNIGGSGDLISKIWVKTLPVFNKTWYILRILIYAAIVTLIIMLFYKFYLRYNKMAIVRRVSGGKIVDIIIDRCMIKEDEDLTKRIILFRKYNGIRLSFPIVPGKFVYKSGKKDLYELWVDDNLQVQPCEFEIPSNLIQKCFNGIRGGMVNFDVSSFDRTEMARIKPQPQERSAWVSMERKKQREKIRTENPFLKYASILFPYVSAAIALLLFYFAFKELGGIGTSIGGGLQAVAESCLK